MPILLVGLGGVALLRRPLSLVIYATLAIYLVFDWMYRCANWYQVILPPTRCCCWVWPLPPLRSMAGDAERKPHSVFPYIPLLLLAVALIWRLGASWERPTAATAPATRRLTAPPSCSTNRCPTTGLFAPVDDALALDYLKSKLGGFALTWPWSAASRQANGWQRAERCSPPMTPRRCCCPNCPPISSHGAPRVDWLRLSSAPAPAVAPAHTLEQELVPASFSRATRLRPPQPARRWTEGQAEPGQAGTPALQAVDVTLTWGLLGQWPQGWASACARRQAGPLSPPRWRGQGHHPGGCDRPAARTWPRPATALLADTYRVPFPPGADGLLLIVYTREDDGFRNLLELPLDIGAPALP